MAADEETLRILGCFALHPRRARDPASERKGSRLPLPSNAEIVNAYDFLLKRARACRKQRKMMPNLIAVDFYKTGDLFRVVDTMNGVGAPQTAAAKK